MPDKGFWMNRNVFITGATGFIGSWITKELIDLGANVSILVRDLHFRPLKFMSYTYPELENVIIGSLSNYTLINRILNEYEIDTCFHLAAQTIVGKANISPLSTFDSNIRGTWNLLEASRNSESVQRVVIASSDKAYGEPIQLPINEEHPLLAIDPYGASKACVDILARTYFETYGLPVTVTRCANVYGGGDLNFSRIVPGTIRSVLLDEDPIIRSDGSPIRDYMYITDAVCAYLVLAENIHRTTVKGQAFNFGTSNPTSVLDLVNRIIRITGKTNLEPVILGKAAKEISIQYLSSHKAKSLLNWESKTTLNEGLALTIKWYQEKLPALSHSMIRR